MSHLEDFIRNHREAFDAELPDAGHMERFGNRVQRPGRLVHLRLPSFARAAAVLALVIMSSLWLWDHVAGPNPAMACNTRPLATLSPELAETEAFLTTTISKKIDEINALGPEARQWQSRIALKEFIELDSLMQSLCADIQAKPGDQRIIDAMILHYQTKIGILDRILTDLKSSKTQQSKSHESIQH